MQARRPQDIINTVTGLDLQATTVSMAALFAGHQIGTKNGPYYGENIDTPAKL